MSVLIISFLISLLSIFWIVRYNHLHARYTSDSDIYGVQKFHTTPVPRIGGAGLFLAVLLALASRYFENNLVGMFGILLLLSALPAFLAGLLEDLTKSVGVKFRLIATMLSAVFAGFFLDGWLTSVQILGIDNLMVAYPVFAVAITCIAVGGVANAFNIIDGYNGLSGMVAVLILFGIAYVAFQVNDYPIMISAIAMIGALLGFLIWNYPRGLVFLGDGGAYLIGFWIAELSVLLTARHPEVSKWFPLLLCAYPIFETLFTMYRRIVLRRVHPGSPDASHLHQLIYKRVVRWSTEKDDPAVKSQHNAMTSPYLWLLTLFAVIPAILFWRYHIVLKIFTLIFAITYVWIYWGIVRHRVPEYLVIRRQSK
jgi:UDP-N-acetylmuramyl pentapeptide phosphotransferase/UDP-N-acetylglucosamine-1-phosphate transferase